MLREDPKASKKGTNTFEDRAVQFVDRCADWLTTRYRAALADSLKYTPVTLVFGALILTSIYWLYSNSKSELAPIEDQNLVLVSAVSSPDATLDQKLLYGGEIAKILNSMPQTRSLFQIYQSGQDITGVVFSSQVSARRALMSFRQSSLVNFQILVAKSL